MPLGAHLPGQFSRFPGPLLPPAAAAAADTPTQSEIFIYPALAFDAINLARATGLLSILPAAFYVACSSSLHLRTIHQNIISGLPGPKGLVQLSDADKALCILSTSALLERQWAGPYGWTHNVKICPGCRSGREAVAASLGRPVQIMVALDPRLRVTERLRLCEVCKPLSDNGFSVGQLEGPPIRLRSSVLGRYQEGDVAVRTHFLSRG